MRRERPRSVSVAMGYGCDCGFLSSGTVAIGMLRRTSARVSTLSLWDD